jgi:ketosteroid isomerase-like protein
MGGTLTPVPINYKLMMFNSLEIILAHLKVKTMSQKQNSDIAQKLLTGIGKGADPDTIAALFSDDVEFEIPGDDGVLPWIGRKAGRSAVVDFICGLRSLTEPVKFDIQDVLASEDRAVIVGELATRIKATGKIIESAFAIVLTVSDSAISRFQMLEDSFEVSRAARQ